MNLVDLARFGKGMGNEVLGLGKNIINNKIVSQVLTVGGALGGSIVAGTFGSRWLNEKFPENQASSKKLVQEDGLAKSKVPENSTQKAAPVKSKAAEPVKETVYYVKKAAANPAQEAKPVKKTVYYVKKAVANPAQEAQHAQSNTGKLTVDSSHDQVGAKKLTPNTVAAQFVPDSSHHDVHTKDFVEVDMTGIAVKEVA